MLAFAHNLYFCSVLYGIGAGLTLQAVACMPQRIQCICYVHLCIYQGRVMGGSNGDIMEVMGVMGEGKGKINVLYEGYEGYEGY